MRCDGVERPPVRPISASRPASFRWLPARQFAVACLCVVGITGALAATGLLQKASSSSGARTETLTASVGDALTIDNVTVTLTSAAILTAVQPANPVQVAPSGEPGQVVRGVTFSLHFSNQTTHFQSVSMANWQLVDAGGNSFALISEGNLPVGLAPNATLDRQCTAPMGVGGYSPYTLLTDVTTSDGKTLGWTFTGQNVPMA
jgi:hypothetical protein